MNRKGQRVITPGGKGEVLETIGDKVVVKLDSGEVSTYPPPISKTTAARVNNK
jgi:hypothetical protein